VFDGVLAFSLAGTALWLRIQTDDARRRMIPRVYSTVTILPAVLVVAVGPNGEIGVGLRFFVDLLAPRQPHIATARRPSKADRIAPGWTSSLSAISLTSR
jgi:hypothetical protein